MIYKPFPIEGYGGGPAAAIILTGVFILDEAIFSVASMDAETNGRVYEYGYITDRILSEDESYRQTVNSDINIPLVLIVSLMYSKGHQGNNRDTGYAGLSEETINELLSNPPISSEEKK